MFNAETVYHREGDVGLGPCSVRVGDLSVVCFGGKAPYVLCELEADGKCQLIEESYVHGMTKGGGSGLGKVVSFYCYFDRIQTWERVETSPLSYIRTMGCSKW